MFHGGNAKHIAFNFLDDSAAISKTMSILLAIMFGVRLRQSSLRALEVGLLRQEHCQNSLSSYFPIEVS